MTTKTLTLTREQALALAPLRCAAREAATDHKPGLVLGQVYFMKDGSVRLVAGFIGHETGQRICAALAGTTEPNPTPEA